MQQPEKIFWGIAAVALLYLVLGAPAPLGSRTAAQASGPVAAGQEGLPTGSCHTGGGGCGCGGGAQ